MGSRRGVHGRIGRGQLVMSVQLGGQQGNWRVERNDDAFLRVRDHLVDTLLTELAPQPLLQFELHDGRDDPRFAL